MFRGFRQSSDIDNRKRDNADLFWGAAKHFEYSGKPSVCIDIGSCRGHYAQYYSCIFKKVICFEPNIYLTEILQKNINQCNDPWTNDVEIHMVALGKRAEKNKTFYAVHDLKKTRWQGISSFNKEYLDRRKNVFKEKFYITEMKVEVRTLDSYKLVPSFIKIDAELSEADIIEGGKETILKYRPTLQVEGPHTSDMILDMGYTHVQAQPYQLNLKDNIYIYKPDVTQSTSRI